MEGMNLGQGRNHLRKGLLIGAACMDGQRTGIGRYAYEIARRLPALIGNQPLLGFDGIRCRSWSQQTPSETVETCGTLLSGVKQLIPAWPWMRSGLRSMASRIGTACIPPVAVYWEPNNILERRVRARRRVVTVHDLTTITHPEWHPADRVRFFRRHLLPGLRLSEAIITVSQHVRDEIASQWPELGSKIHIIANGIDHEVFHPRDERHCARILGRLPEVPGRFVLCLATFEPRKNLELLVDAWSRCRSAGCLSQRLILVGGQGWSNRQLMDKISRSAGILSLGYQPNEVVAALMSRCDCFVFTSREEGFGLPPLEAMACGAPTLALANPPMPEVLGDGALLCPGDISTAHLADTLMGLLADDHMRAQLRRRGLARAQSFSWQRSAEQTAKVLRGEGMNNSE